MGEDRTSLRTRLQKTALDLFRERGYDRTTAAEIAAQAGVTERTFFRQFPDKREVLFDGEAVLREALLESIAVASIELGPIAMLFSAFHSVVPLLESNRSFSVPRQEVISATPALQEREFAKHAALSDALALALKARGIATLPAVIAARTGVAVFVYATTAWLYEETPCLGERLELASAELRALLAT